VAECAAPAFMAIGVTPQAAAENGRLVALAMLPEADATRTVFVQVGKPRHGTLIAQMLSLPIDMELEFKSSARSGDPFTA
jgi:hypothetical protein